MLQIFPYEAEYVLTRIPFLVKNFLLIRFVHFIFEN